MRGPFLGFSFSLRFRVFGWYVRVFLNPNLMIYHTSSGQCDSSSRFPLSLASSVRGLKGSIPLCQVIVDHCLGQTCLLEATVPSRFYDHHSAISLDLLDRDLKEPLILTLGEPVQQGHLTLTELQLLLWGSTRQGTLSKLSFALLIFIEPLHRRCWHGTPDGVEVGGRDRH